MNKLIKVKEHPHLRRDASTGAIINTNNEEWYKRKRKKALEIRQRDKEMLFNALWSKVETLEKKVQMLEERLNRDENG